MSTELPHFFARPTRRHFLQRAGTGLGSLALASLLADTPALASEGALKVRAKRVIWLFMNGGPSQVDTWDYKPALEKYDGQALKGFDAQQAFSPTRSGH